MSIPQWVCLGAASLNAVASNAAIGRMTSLSPVFTNRRCKLVSDEWSHLDRLLAILDPLLGL
jgi:hypothetical protein